MLLTLIYAFGTSSLSVSSQALWQHGPAQLALAAAIYCLVRARDDPRWAGYAGLPLAFEVITRPADALIAAPLACMCSSAIAASSGVSSRPRLRRCFFNCGTTPRTSASPLRMQFFRPSRSAVRPWRRAVCGRRRFEGLGAGGAQSRPRTAFLFADFHFLTGRIGAGLAKNGDVLLRYLGVGAILSIMLVANGISSGGESFGPRLLADITPIMAFALFPLADSIRNRRALAAAFGCSAHGR